MAKPNAALNKPASHGLDVSPIAAVLRPCPSTARSITGPAIRQPIRSMMNVATTAPTATALVSTPKPISLSFSSSSA